MKRIAIAVLALLVAALFVPGAANAMTPDEPARVCPGPNPNTLPSRNAMFCSTTTPDAQPFYTNYVGEVNGEQQFCRATHYPAEKLECHPYWPFVNPTINGYLAPASAFTGTRLVTDQITTNLLVQTIDRQDRRIRQLRKQIRQLRHHH